MNTSTIVLLAVLGALVLAGSSVLHSAAGFFDRRRFEAIVEEVRRRPIQPGEEVALRLAAPWMPGSVRLVEAECRLVRGGGAGLVWASRTKEGHLKVVIETRDLGHAGEYGFAYSDVPLTLSPLDASWSTADVPGRLDIVGADARIDEHWWAVLNNLD